MKYGTDYSSALQKSLLLDFSEEHLSNLFHISLSTVSRIVISWVNFMYLKFVQINIWLSRTVIDNTMPEAFKAEYSATRVSTDCTEVRCQMPSSLQFTATQLQNASNTLPHH